MINKNIKYARIVYAALFLLLLAVEIYIGMYVHDSFVRPYIGDLLVVILLWALVRILIPNKVVWLSGAILIFSVLVELSQLIPLVDLLGIKNRLIRVLMGTSFAYGDLFAYAAGCAITAVVDIMLFRKKEKEQPEDSNEGEI